MAAHFCLILMFLDSSISCPFELLFAALDVYVAVEVLKHKIGEVCSKQLLILAETIGSSLLHRTRPATRSSCVRSIYDA